MTGGLAILFSLFVFVSSAESRSIGLPSGPHLPSDLESRTTDDNKTVWSFHVAGVWGIIHPRETEAEFVWLHHDGRLTMRAANCGVLVQGRWEYDGPLLEFFFADESRSTFQITRVPAKGRTNGYGKMVLLNNGQFQVWQGLGKETEKGCS